MMYEDGFNIEEWKAKKLAERQETFAAQEEALKDVFASGQTLANYFYQRGRLGSHITAGNTALILRANPLACAVMSRRSCAAMDIMPLPRCLMFLRPTATSRTRLPLWKARNRLRKPLM